MSSARIAPRSVTDVIRQRIRALLSIVQEHIDAPKRHADFALSRRWWAVNNFNLELDYALEIDKVDDASGQGSTRVDTLSETLHATAFFAFLGTSTGWATDTDGLRYGHYDRARTFKHVDGNGENYTTTSKGEGGVLKIVDSRISGWFFGTPDGKFGTPDGKFSSFTAAAIAFHLTTDTIGVGAGHQEEDGEFQILGNDAGDLPADIQEVTGTFPDHNGQGGTLTYRLSPVSQRASVVRVWLNIFIPSTGAETVIWPGHAGMTLVRTLGPPNLPSPIPLRFFATDQRTFSSDPEASARVKVAFELFLGDGGYALLTETEFGLDDATIRTGVTTEVNGSTGAVLDTGQAKPTMTTLGPPTLAENVWTVPVAVAAADPLVGVAPTVGIEGDFSFTMNTDGSLTVSFAGSIDHWPAYEMYAQTVEPFTFPVALMKVSEDPGTSAYDLLSPRDKFVTADITVPATPF